jgi:hypothetical protein
MGLAHVFPRNKDVLEISDFSPNSAEIPHTIPQRMEYFPHGIEYFSAHIPPHLRYYNNCNKCELQNRVNSVPSFHRMVVNSVPSFHRMVVNSVLDPS